MPDITMCNDETCPIRNECYRFRAIPSEHRQAYFVDSPREGDKCNEFTPINGRRYLMPVTSEESQAASLSQDDSQSTHPHESYPSGS